MLMFLKESSLQIIFKITGNRSMECFDCRDIRHKRLTSSHKAQASAEEAGPSCVGVREAQTAVGESTGQLRVREGGVASALPAAAAAAENSAETSAMEERILISNLGMKESPKLQNRWTV